MNKKIKKSNIQTWNNYNTSDNKGEVNNEPSLTIPNQTMSIKDLLARHTRGQAVPFYNTAYEFDQDTPDEEAHNSLELDKLDTFDRSELKELVRDEIYKTKSKISERYNRVKKEQKEALSKQQAKPSEDKPKNEGGNPSKQ